MISVFCLVRLQTLDGVVIRKRTKHRKYLIAYAHLNHFIAAFSFGKSLLQLRKSL